MGAGVGMAKSVMRLLLWGIALVLVLASGNGPTRPEQAAALALRQAEKQAVTNMAAADEAERLAAIKEKARLLRAKAVAENHPNVGKDIMSVRRKVKTVEFTVPLKIIPAWTKRIGLP